MNYNELTLKIAAVFVSGFSQMHFHKFLMLIISPKLIVIPAEMVYTDIHTGKLLKLGFIYCYFLSEIPGTNLLSDTLKHDGSNPDDIWVVKKILAIVRISKFLWRRIFYHYIAAYY
jgi:hypothetical protein